MHSNMAQTILGYGMILPIKHYADGYTRSKECPINTNTQKIDEKLIEFSELIKLELNTSWINICFEV